MDKLNQSLLNRLIVRDLDLHGKRVVNAGKSGTSTDYIRQDEVADLADSYNTKNTFWHKLAHLFKSDVTIEGRLRLPSLPGENILKVDKQGYVTPGVAGGGFAITDLPDYLAIDLTGVNSAIGATNLQPGGVMLAAGLYIIFVNMFVSATSVAGTITFRIFSNDGVSVKTTSAAVLTTNTNNFAALNFPIYTSGTNDIQYDVTFTGISGTPAVDIHLVMFRLSA